MASGSFTPLAPQLARERRVTVVKRGPASPERLRALTQTALEKAVAGRIRPIIGQEFELSQAAGAHAAIEARTTTGKTLLTVSR
jgi:NADPH:quinone reductase